MQPGPVLQALPHPADDRHRAENGITCNLFWCDDPKEAKRFFEMGIDVILTNNYLHTAQALQG